MTSRHVVLLVAALALGGCPPPADVDDAAVQPKKASKDGGGARPRDGEPASDSTPGAAVPGTGGATVAAAPTSRAEPVVYERLRGGVFVSRCPACGEVQAPGATACPGCRQALSPWRKEAICTRCVGEGRCDHCGDDRACLACDGDGACASCGGNGRLKPAGGGKGPQCPECLGNGRCTACRGDARRSQVSGDFGAAEGWMPGACGTCIDGAGICPDCGSAGKDRAGGVCITCAGSGACPDCAGEGGCTWCSGDGACTVCAGGGREIVNGEPLRPDERTRRVSTPSGSIVVGRLDGAPTAQLLRLSRTENAKPVVTTLSRTQVDPLAWFLVQRDFPPGWDGRTVPDRTLSARFHGDLAEFASQSKLWPLALAQHRAAIAADPTMSQPFRTAIDEVETRRIEDWAQRADAAAKAGDTDRAAVLLEMIVFKARGTALATRAELQLLQVRKDREVDAAKLSETDKVRRATDAKANVERTILRTRRRLDRARSLVERAARAGPDETGADRIYARAEHAASSARRLAQSAAARDPASVTSWSVPPESIVTEARRSVATILEAWATRAASGARFDLTVRLARRGLALDAANETLRRLLAEAEEGLARLGVHQGSPPPGRR